LQGGIDPVTENAIVMSESVVISAYNDTLSMYIDGGDTEGLNLDVYTSMPPEALQIRQELLDESPYLSDTVLNTAILKENVLPNAMIRDVLVANPQSAKSVSVMQTLEQRFDPMPEYMMAEIMQGQGITGAKEVYEKKLASHKTKKYTSFSKLMHYYNADTINTNTSFDSAASLLNNENNPNARYRLAMSYLGQSDSANTFSTLSNIPIEFGLDQMQLQVFDLFSDLFEILWDIETDTAAPDSIQIQSLFNLAENQDCQPGIYARNLLVNMGMMTYIEPIYLPDNFKSEEYLLPKGNKCDPEIILKVFPNPAGDYFIAYYEIPDEIIKPVLTVTGINGVPVHSIRLNEPLNQLVVPMNNNPSGIYLVCIVSGNKIIASSKVIISR